MKKLVLLNEKSMEDLPEKGSVYIKSINDKVYEMKVAAVRSLIRRGKNTFRSWSHEAVERDEAETIFTTQ